MLFLDTVHHFAADATRIATRWQRAWKLNLSTCARRSRSRDSGRREHRQPAARATRSDRCSPRSSSYDIWFTALRREQSPSRANLQEVEPFRLPSGKVIQRVSPLASWTARDVWKYAKEHDDPAAAALRAGLHEHRLRAVHDAAARSRQPALGPLAGPEARMRDPYSGEVKTQITNPKSQTPSPMSFVAWDSGFGSWDLGFTS